MLIVILGIGLLVSTGGTALAAPPNATPLPTITSKPAAFVNSTTAVFTFTNTNPSAVFSCSRDGAKATTCTSPVTYTGLAVGAHTFTVRAQAPGLRASKTVAASWTIDLTAPGTPSVSQPASPTNSTTASITFSSSSTDIASYQCSLDGAAFATCSSPRSLTGLAEGFHRFAVKAVDHAGNVSGTRTVSWAVDRSAATPVITSAPPSISTGAVSFTFGSTDTDVTFSCSMDSTTTFTACTSPKSYTGLSNASHTFRVRATDTVGNVSTAAAYTWIVQAVPAIALSWSNPAGLPGAVTKQTAGTFAFDATGQTSLTCRLDGVDQPSCTSPASVSGLTDGQHTFAVVASPGLVTLRYVWVVDTTPPTAPTIEGPSGRLAETTADIVVQPAAIGDVVTCQVDGSPRACAAPFTLSGLTDGDHSVTATASDAAGNTATASVIWTVDTTGPTATIQAPTSLTGAFGVTFDERAVVDAAAVVVTNESGAPLATTRTCLTWNSAASDCSTGDIRSMQLTASDRLTLGQNYRVLVNPVGAELVADDLGNVASAVDAVVRAPITAGESSVGATFTWRKVSDKKAVGGSYFAERRKGARASWTFSGKAVTWLTVTGPTFGKADIYVDGVRKATVNNYAKTITRGVARTVKGLTKGSHTVEIRALGKKGAKAGKGTFVAIDGFRVGKTVTATPSLSKVGWQHIVSVSASDSGYVVADLKGQSMKTTVRGTSVTVHGVRGPAYGKAGIFVDGKLMKTVDLYASSVAWGDVATVTGLTDATHTVLIKVLGAKNAKSSGTAVVVDGLSVG